MKNQFRSMNAVLQSDLATAALSRKRKEAGTDRVLKSTRLEDMIYSDLRAGDALMDGVEAACTPRLATFPALSRDMFQSLYPLNIKQNDEGALSSTARKFNKHILESVMGGDDYPTIKSVCEGRELPAYDAAAEFSANVSGELDALLQSAGGDKNSLATLEKLEMQRDQLCAKLQSLLERVDTAMPDQTLNQEIVNTANRLQSKAEQVEAVDKMVSDNLMKNKDAVRAIVTQAAHAAKEKAEDTADAIIAWGGDPADPKQVAANREVLARVRDSAHLTEITKQLGRLREIAAKAKRDSYAYGRGEKYDIELGSNLRHVISSEFALLALPETRPLFVRKYQQKRLKQYRRRERIAKGRGDIIFCLDESGSTAGEAAAWGKAVALTMLQLAAEGGRKFALIHFSGRGSYKTDLFSPKQYGPMDVLTAAETFLDGGTDYETPLAEALRLIEQEGFENADIVFATDGACALPEHMQERLKAARQAHRFTVTGILMDAGESFAFSLEDFCETIYRTSELGGDEIVGGILVKRV